MDNPHNQWDDRFSQQEYVYGTEPNQFVATMAPRLRPGSLLAIAEGEGRNAVYLAGFGHEVTTWDYASSGLKKTKKLAEEKGLRVQTEWVDLWDAPWKKENWDTLVCVFGHFPRELREKTLHGIKEAVKPGGFFLCEVYSIYQLTYKTGGPPTLDMLYSPEEFLEVFKDWEILHFFLGETERYEGKLHHGLCHVIQFFGRKPYKEEGIK